MNGIEAQAQAAKVNSTADKIGFGASIFLVIGMLLVISMGGISTPIGIALTCYSLAFGFKQWETLVLRRKIDRFADMHTADSGGAMQERNMVRVTTEGQLDDLTVTGADIPEDQLMFELQAQTAIEVVNQDNVRLRLSFDMDGESLVAETTGHSQAKKKNAEFPQLHEDAPEVPDGLQPLDGVEYGCGSAGCRDCYRPRA